MNSNYLGKRQSAVLKERQPADTEQGKAMKIIHVTSCSFEFVFVKDDNCPYISLTLLQQESCQFFLKLLLFYINLQIFGIVVTSRAVIDFNI